MDRRYFLQSLIASAVAIHELDIEKLLWVPGEKTIFIPPPVSELVVYAGFQFDIDWPDYKPSLNVGDFLMVGIGPTSHYRVVDIKPNIVTIAPLDRLLRRSLEA